MNWLDQLIGYERWNENGNYLATNAQVLWYKLMWVNNTCSWQEWFAVDNYRLMALTHISNQQTLIRAKQKLIEAGMIEYRKGKKGKPSQYRMVPFHEINFNFESTNVNKNVNTNVNKNGVQTSTINKHKQKLKQKHNTVAAAREALSLPPEMRDEGLAHAVHCYEANYNYGRPIPPARGEEFKDWCERLSGELLALVLELTISETDQPSWQYAKCKLVDWEQNGITDIDGAKRRNEQWRQTRTGNYKQGGGELNGRLAVINGKAITASDKAISANSNRTQSVTEKYNLPDLST